jgi:hypothetical protein
VSDFWKSSPLWQSQQELKAELEAAGAKREKAGLNLLARVWVYGPERSTLEEEARDDFYEAMKSEEAARTAWEQARHAFEVSEAGRAKATYLAFMQADPIARESAIAKEEESPCP